MKEHHNRAERQHEQPGVAKLAGSQMRRNYSSRAIWAGAKGLSFYQRRQRSGRYQGYSVPRPWPVTAIVVMNAISVLLLGYAWFQFLSVGAQLTASGTVPDSFYYSYGSTSNIKAVLQLLTCIIPIGMMLQIVLSLGLWNLRKWARIITLVLYALSIASSAVELFTGHYIGGLVITVVNFAYAIGVFVALSVPTVSCVFE